jgi:hypothetical protein
MKKKTIKKLELKKNTLCNLSKKDLQQLKGGISPKPTPASRCFVCDLA